MRVDVNEKRSLPHTSIKSYISVASLIRRHYEPVSSEPL